MTQQNSERKNNTKKTAVIVALLLALIALLCFGGYTFSKYVTSDKGSGTAQVAKWGYTVNVDGSELFGKKYVFDGANTSTVNNDAAQVSVAASADNNVVAPGTSGKITFKVNGTAEVTSKLNIKIDNVKEISLTAKKTGVADEVYKPVKWTLKKGGAVVVTDGTLADVAAKIAVTDTEIAANTNLGTDYEYELSWEWVFEDAATTVAGFTVDQLDTFLGQDAAASGDYTFDKVTETSFNLTIKVEQVQTNK